jgi:predicted dehydrogenase
MDPQNLWAHQKPQVLTFPQVSTERAELEHFARAAQAKRPLAVAGGDEVHGVAIFEAILRSAKTGTTVRLAAPRAARSRSKRTQRRR